MSSSRSPPVPSDDSDISDLFLNSGFSAYPYREPRISASLYQTDLPPLSTKPPPASTFIPRGGGKASDWCVWNPSALPSPTVASYLQLAGSLSPQLGEEEVLCLLRDANYDVSHAKHYLLDPLLHDEERGQRRRRGGLRERWQVGGPWSGVRLRGVKRGGEEQEGEDEMRREVESFEQAKRDKDSAELSRNREEVKAAFDLACKLINYHPHTPTAAGALSNGSGKTGSGEIDNGEVVVDDDESTEAAASTRSPSPVTDEIDVAVLRHVISMLVDVGDAKMRRNSIPSTDSLPSAATTVSPSTAPTTTTQPSITAALNTLQTVLSLKHDWLDKARPILSSLNKTAKDNTGVLLTTLHSLLDEADTRAPLIGSKDKKRLRQVLQRCHEWRERWQPMYDRVQSGQPVGDGDEERMTLADVGRLVREYDRQCGGVVMDESLWYRQVMELGRRFVAVYNEKVRREERREDDEEEDEQDVVERRETRAEREKEKDKEKEEGDHQPKQPPAKLTIEEAEELLTKVRSQAPFLSLPETAQLSTHIAAAKEWLSSTSASISSLDTTSDEAVSHCRALLASASSFPLQLQTHHLSTLLELKLFTHRIDALYNRPAASTTDSALSSHRPSLESLLHLLREADVLRLPTAGKRITAIRQQAKQAEQLAARIVTALNPKSKRLPLVQWEELLQQVKQLPLLLQLEEARVERVVNNTKEWLAKAAELMARIRDSERHWLEFDEVDGLVNRVSGKNIALIASESVELLVLRTVLRCGRVWMHEANTCLKAMRTLGGGHGMHSDEYRDKHVRVERRSAAEKLRWLLAVYEDEKGEDTLTASSITRLLSGEQSESDTTLQPSSAPSAASSSVSFPESFFAKNKLSAADFYHTLRLLSLPFASRIQDRLDEVTSLVSDSNALIAAATPTPLSELANTVYELRRAGVDEDEEPLLTLRRRWDMASRWRREVLLVLPVGSVVQPAQTEQPKIRTVKRVQRARRSRPKNGKKEVPAVTALREEAQAEEKDGQAAEDGSEEKDRMDVDEVQQATEEDTVPVEEDEEEAEEDDQAADDAPIIPPHPPAHLSQLVTLQQQYHQHTLTTDSTPTTTTDASTSSTAIHTDHFNARLDLVSLPELSYLNSTIATCLAWQQAAQHALHSPLPTVADVKALLSQGRALGVLMTEMDELEAASWRRMWEWEVREELRGGEKGDMEWEAGVELLRGLKRRYMSYDVMGRVRKVWDEEERKGMMLEDEDDEEKADSDDEADEGEEEDEEAGGSSSSSSGGSKKSRRSSKQKEVPSSAAVAPAITSTAVESALSASTSAVALSLPNNSVDTSVSIADFAPTTAQAAVEPHTDAATLDTTMQSELEAKLNEPPAPSSDSNAVMEDVSTAEAAPADASLVVLVREDRKEATGDVMDVDAAPAAPQPPVAADTVVDTPAPSTVISDLSVDVMSEPVAQLASPGAVVPSPSSAADDGFLSAVSSELHSLELRVLLYWMWSRRLHALFSRRLGAVMGRILLGTDVKPLKETIEADDDSRDSAKADKKANKRRVRPTANAATTATAAPSTSSATPSPASHPPQTSNAVSSAAAASDDDVDVSTLYCYCRRPYMPEDVMVECERCGVWYHIHCLNLTKDDMKRMDKEQFVCPTCCITDRREYKWREKAPTRKRRVMGVRVELLRRRQEARPDGVQGDEKRKVDDMLAKGEEWANRARVMLDKVKQTVDERQEELRLEEVEKAQEAEWQDKLRELADRRKRALERKAEQQTEKAEERRGSVTVGTDDSAAADDTSDDWLRVSITTVVTGTDLHLRVDIVPSSTKDSSATEKQIDSNGADSQEHKQEVKEGKEVKRDRSKKVKPKDKDRGKDKTKDKLSKEKDGKDNKGADNEPHAVPSSSTNSTAITSSSPSSLSSSLPPLFDKVTVARLKEEKAERERALNARMSYTDRLQQHLRDGLSIPLEMRERRELEDRVRLLLALEKAERILLVNTLTVRAADTPAGASVSRKNEMKGLTELWESLNKMEASSYREHDHTLNRIYPRFAAWYQQLYGWNATVSSVLQASSSSASTPYPLSSLLDYQTTQKLLFQSLPLPSIVELNLRVAACIRWLPKERKVWQKQSRQSTLAKLLADRFKECGNVQSDWTVRIVRELDRADEWNRRMEEAIEQKQGRSAFEALLQQADGPDRVWLDADDVALCKQYVDLYCLCRQPYQNGIFMIGCDQCDDWYHPACVGLTEPQANKIKKYICPRCCKRDGKPYPHGDVKGGVVTATVDKMKDDKDKKDSSKKQKKTDEKAKQRESTDGGGGAVELDSEKKKRKKEKREKERAETGKVKPVKAEKAEGAAEGDTTGKEKKKKRKRDKEKEKEGEAAGKVEDGGTDKERKDGAEAEHREHKKKKRRRDGEAVEMEGGEKRKKKHRSVEEEEARKKRKRSASLPSTAPSSPALIVAASSSGSGSAAAPTAEVYANLLYEHLHRMVSAEQSNILWHLFHSYMTRPFDGRLMEEINEAVKLVCGNECKEDTLKAVADRVLQEYVDKTGHVSLLPRKERKRKRAEEKHRAEKERAERDDKKEKKGRSKKPKGYPRAPKSAFKFFVSFVTNHRKVELERLVAEQGGDVRQQGRIIAEQWKKLSVEEKEVFEVEARKERERFNSELKRWEQREAERQMREELEKTHRSTSAEQGGGAAGSSDNAATAKSSSSSQSSSRSSSPKQGRHVYPPPLTVHADTDMHPQYYFAQSAGSPSTAVPSAFVYPSSMLGMPAALYSPQFGLRHPGQAGAVHMMPVQMIQGQNGQIMYVIPSPHQHMALQQHIQEARQATPAAVTQKADSKHTEGTSDDNKADRKETADKKEGGEDSSAAPTAAAVVSTSLPGQLRLHPQFQFTQPQPATDGLSSTSPTPVASSSNRSSPSKSAVSSPSKASTATAALMQQPMLLLPMSLQSPHALQLLLQQQHFQQQQQQQQQQLHLQQLLQAQQKQQQQQQATAAQQVKAAIEPMHIEEAGDEEDEDSSKQQQQDVQPESGSQVRRHAG